jgi:hypothetical protein
MPQNLTGCMDDDRQVQITICGDVIRGCIDTDRKPYVDVNYNSVTGIYAINGDATETFAGCFNANRQPYWTGLPDCPDTYDNCAEFDENNPRTGQSLYMSLSGLSGVFEPCNGIDSVTFNPGSWTTGDVSGSGYWRFAPNLITCGGLPTTGIALYVGTKCMSIGEDGYPVVRVYMWANCPALVNVDWVDDGGVHCPPFTARCSTSNPQLGLYNTSGDIIFVEYTGIDAVSMYTHPSGTIGVTGRAALGSDASCYESQSFIGEAISGV